MTIRIFAALSLLLAGLAPRPVAAEAGPTQRMHATAGHTSLLALDADGPEGAAPETGATLWLHRDHGTLRQTVRGLSPGESVGLFAGVGDVQPALSGVFAGRVPALWSSAPLLTPPVAAPDADGRFWRWRPALGDFTVAWTVPYAGDTWGLTGQRDCSCGSPIEASLMHMGLTVRTGDLGHPALSAGVPLTVHNRAGVAVDVFEGRAPLTQLAPGRSASIETRGAPLTFAFIDGWTPPPGWAPPLSTEALAAMHRGHAGLGHQWHDVRLRARCAVVGTGADDAAGAPRPGEGLSVRCAVGDPHRGPVIETVRPISALRSRDAWGPERRTPRGGSGDTPPPDPAFVADVLREAVAPKAPGDLGRWPLLGRRRTLTHAGARWTALDAAALSIEATSTLPSASGRYAADNLLDGDPTTAWCEGAPGQGLGEALRVVGAPTDRPLLVAVIPGYARGDWHFAANGAPVALRGPSGEGLAPIRLPDSADLYREGQALEVVGVLPAGAPVELSLAAVRAGRSFDDACLSELVLFERR